MVEMGKKRNHLHDVCGNLSHYTDLELKHRATELSFPGVLKAEHSSRQL